MQSINLLFSEPTDNDTDAAPDFAASRQIFANELNSLIERYQELEKRQLQPSLHEWDQV